jgi:hypothetical protein
MISNKNIYLLIVLSSLLINGCKNKNTLPGTLHFTQMNAGETNIDFNNEITESDSINVYNNEYMYNGSGVGIGDFNNDGLQDIFFCGSMVTSRLYLNKGNFKFEDITEKAGVQTNEWCTGASVVDINNDGFQDIYVSASHSVDKEKRRNRLFVNDGHLHFTEQAAAYGLADTGFSTQAAFFDYDKDGDLDMYLLNHRLYNPNPNNLVPRDSSGTSPAADCLYRNEGVSSTLAHPVYKNVSIEAGVKEDGYGLGIVITDVNNDNWPDVYVANDYLGSDVLWLNNGDGTFSNTIARSIQHQSFNSMGVDAADVNNDCLPDIAVLDMSPEINERKKMMFNGSSQERYDMERRLGYEPGFVRNMLQLNNGTRKVSNRDEPFYSEIGQLAGISETDWSWSILMADFDNDGWKDIHVTNGLGKDVTNNDYVSFKNSQSEHDYDFSGQNIKRGADKKSLDVLRKNLDQYGSIKINNYFFHNNGNLTFSNSTEQAGIATPSVSNGAAYADLDNDGDLDLVVNNMNQPAFLWKNEVRKSVKDRVKNFIAFKLAGPAGNVNGLESKVWLYSKGSEQFVEQSPVRGFSSSVDNRLHFGIGKLLVIDSLKVQWPDNKVQVLKDVKANQLLNLNYANAVEGAGQSKETFNTLLNDASPQLNGAFTHVESQFFDFGSQRGVPQRYSQLGPCIATGDVNGDGLMDFYVGGASRQNGKIFIQNKSGSFDAKDLVKGAMEREDLGAVFFDSDGDRDLDLLITGGSAEFGGQSAYNQPVFCSNDGKGDFILNAGALPSSITNITKEVAVADYDGDGDLDVFIGGRLVPQQYPESPRSYILQNNNGTFKDVTKDVCPSVEFGGLITGVVFTDFNNDKKPDLVICGEWMPVRFFVNENGRFKEVTQQTGLQQMSGQWRSLQAADLDSDGDIDFVAGNLGLNNKFHIAPGKPLKLYAGDFDGNNSGDLIPAYYIKNKEGAFELFPGLDRTQLADQMPSIKKKYLLNSDYSRVNMQALLKNLPAKSVVEKSCETTASVWIENLGKGKFKQHVLPTEAQFAPVNAVLAEDMDGDGLVDLLLAGNEYQTEVVAGRYDASFGLFLKGDGKGAFSKVSSTKSGFIVDGDVKSMALVKGKQGKMVIAAVNNEKLRCFRVGKPK